MDKQRNEKIYLKKCISLCVTLLCVYAAPSIVTRVVLLFTKSQINLPWHTTFLNIMGFMRTYALFACAILLIIFLVKRSRTCKECKAWNSMKKINVELVGRQATTVRKTMQSKTEITDWTGMEPLGTATTTTTYDAPAEFRTYKHTFQCNQCGNRSHSNRSAIFPG